MDLKTLTDDQLVWKTKSAVKVETNSTADVIRCFCEIYRRETYLKYGFSNLFLMATKYFGYCNGSASLRIRAMKLMLAMPEVEPKINSMDLNLTAAAQLQSFFESQAKTDQPLTPEKKADLIEMSAKKSNDEMQKEFAQIAPKREKKDSKRHIAKGRMRVSHSQSVELEDKLNRIKEIWSSIDSNMSREKLLDRMADLVLKHIDPQQKIARAKTRKARAAAKVDEKAISFAEENLNARAVQSDEVAAVKPVHLDEVTMDVPVPSDQVPAAKSVHLDEVTAEIPVHLHEVATSKSVSKVAVVEEQLELHLDEVTAVRPEVRFNEGTFNRVHPSEVKSRSRYISAEDDRAVREANGGEGCEFVGVTGIRCGSKHQLQRDHIKPFSHGGSNEASNLRMYCAKHNRGRHPRFVKEPSREYLAS